MIQQLTSPSNYSVNENALYLNRSSMISPSQSGFDSGLKENMVQFEEFQKLNSCEPKQPCGKKKLTIRIDQSYDFNNLSEQNRDKLIFHKSDQKFQQSSTTPMSDFNLISPIQGNNPNNINHLQFIKQIQNLENRLLQKQTQLKNTRQILINQRSEFQQQKQQNSRLQQQLTKKDERIEQLTSQVQKYYAQLCEHQDKKRQRDGKMKQLMKINEKLKNLNKDLIYEVKISEKKVRDLQKQAQKSMCMATLQNINKLKESSLKLKQNTYHHTHTSSHYSHNNKENNNLNGGRKSLQRKKTGASSSTGHLHHTKKSNRIASSTSNILTKKLMQK